MDDKDLKIKELETEVEKLRAHLKKYTAPEGSRVYYQKNKEKLIQKTKDFKERTGYQWKATPAQRKATNKRYYLKKKEREAETQEKEAVENVGNIEEKMLLTTTTT